ncbi:unnamed protein product, partial [Polarella glacialis]
MMDRPTEEEVGISEFLHPAVTGFTGRFKSRWQDFHVHEVDTTGVELHLSMLLTPGMVAAEIKKASGERREARAALGPSYNPEADVEAELNEALGSVAAGALIGFLRRQRPPTTRADRQEAAADAPSEEAAGQGSLEPPEPPPGFVDFDAKEIGDGSKE